MTVTSQPEVPNRIAELRMCSLGAASALFDMSDEDFVTHYVQRHAIYADKLHRFKMADVLKLYEALPVSRKRIATNNYYRRKSLPEVGDTLFRKDGVVYSNQFSFSDDKDQ